MRVKRWKTENNPSSKQKLKNKLDVVIVMSDTVEFKSKLVRWDKIYY